MISCDCLSFAKVCGNTGMQREGLIVFKMLGQVTVLLE